MPSKVVSQPETPPLATFRPAALYPAEFPPATLRNSTLGGGDAATVPIVNPPIAFPSFSACTSGDTGTATFTSEFAHHTGFEITRDGQEFWNDTGAVWSVKVVSLAYSIQALGLFGKTNDTLASSAISAGSISSAFTIDVPTHGCESMYNPSLSTHRLSNALRSQHFNKYVVYHSPQACH